MPTLEDAIALAVQIHQGQRDKAGAVYILHPLRVMFRLQTEDERIVAVLHDVVEDSEMTLDDLREQGYNEDILAALDCLTRRDDENYMAFVDRAKKHPIARQVKLADIEDNMDIRRLNRIGEHDLERLQRYRQAWALLQEK